MSLPTWLENSAKHGRRLLQSPGILIGIQHSHDFLFASSGYADIMRQEPFDPETQFRIGSINKVFTSIIVKLLEIKGKINLDDPIQEYLPYLKFYSRQKVREPVRIRHLLTHTSGLGEVRSPKDFISPNLALSVKKEDKSPPLPHYYSKPLALYYMPGTSWYYANHGFGILGALIEEVTGTPYSKVSRDLLFNPLKMERTVILNSETNSPVATGYRVNNKNRAVPVSNPCIIPASAGNAWSTAEDMTRFANELIRSYHGESEVFDHDVGRDLFRSWFQVSPHITRMGLGIFLLPTEPPIAHHGGTINGFNSILLISPNEKISVIMSINRVNRELFFSYSLHLFQKLHRQLGTPVRDSFYLSPNFLLDSPPTLKNLPLSYRSASINLSLGRIVLSIGTRIIIDRHNTCLTLKGNGPMYPSPNILLYIRECENEYHFGIPDASRKIIQKIVLTKNSEKLYLDLFGPIQFEREKTSSLKRRIFEFVFFSLAKAMSKK